MFLLNSNTTIKSENFSPPVISGINILKRDIRKRFIISDNSFNFILLKEDEKFQKEDFVVDVADDITITAGDDLGFVYGLLYISEKFLDIKPFWFWLDQEIHAVEKVAVNYGRYKSSKPIVKYRGWFFNDEVLIMRWNVNSDSVEPWRMAFEALLRCGGNMAIPGTDKNSIKYRGLAADMGLMITHHHAEPLGAEMFTRAYPELDPNYSQHEDKFWKLWEDGVKEQCGFNVIWNVGFRGQGDCPFWSHDSSGQFNTSEKRGKLISDLIQRQCELVERYVDNPVFCTNLYGEVMELYYEGHIKLPPNIIKISADNGYGKMVTRRRDNHVVRISSLPEKAEDNYGIYYHASFYDLQAANHITRLPNSIDFVNAELDQVIAKNAVDYWLINCSNVRPHAYCLDAIRKKWFGENISETVHSTEFSMDYYEGREGIAKCLALYPEAMLSYGSEDDEHAGEQFYNENIRIIVNQFIVNKNEYSRDLKWLTGEIPLNGQVHFIYDIVNKGKEKMFNYYNECEKVSNELQGKLKRLFDATVLLQVKIHLYCAQGVIHFAEGYEAYACDDYKVAFMKLGDSAQAFEMAHSCMREAEYGVWKGFYFNECFADIKHTAYMVKKMMGIVREYGDNVRHDKWYREAVYAVEDRNIMTLLVNDNHMTDWELYTAFKKKEDDEL